MGGAIGGLLPPPPTVTVPAEIQPVESVYLGQLLEVYGEKVACKFATCPELSAHPALVDDLKQQRERFFQAEAFNHHYRDETPPERSTSLLRTSSTRSIRW